MLFRPDIVGAAVCVEVCVFKEKSERSYRPFEHPPVRGEKMSKRLGGIKGCKYVLFGSDPRDLSLWGVYFLFIFKIPLHL